MMILQWLFCPIILHRAGLKRIPPMRLFPFMICRPDMAPDGVTQYDELSVRQGVMATAGWGADGGRGADGGGLHCRRPTSIDITETVFAGEEVHITALAFIAGR